MTTKRERGWIIRGLSIQSAGLSIALSLAFFLSNQNRISATAYKVIAQTGGTTTWGVIFLFCGALVVGASWRGLRPLRVALCISALAYFCLAVAFLLAVFYYSTANLTAPVVYGWIAYAHLFSVGLVTYKLSKAEGKDCD